MKFLSIVAVTALGTVASAREPPTAVRRDTAAASSIIAVVASDIATLDSAVQAYAGGDGTDLAKVADAMKQSIKDATSQVDALPSMTLDDAQALQEPGQQLSDAGQKLLADLDAKTGAFAAAGICAPVLKSVTELGDGSVKLLQAVVAKFPSEAADLANIVVQVTDQAFQQSEAKLSPENCKASGSGSSAPGTTVTAASTATGSKTSSTTYPKATAGAATNAVPAGALALALAAMML